MTSKNIKTDEKHKNILRRVGKSNTIKTNDTTQANKSEGTGERRKTKKISRQDQMIHTKQDTPQQRKKILPASSGENARKHTNNQMRRKQNYFGAKYRNDQIITEKLNG